MPADRDIEALLDRAERSTDAAARALAERVRAAIAQPDREVAVAFGLRVRGGEPPWRTARRHKRDEAIRAFAKIHLRNLSVGAQAREIRRKLSRSGSRAPDTAAGELLQRIVASGLPIPGPRQIINILKQSQGAAL